MTREPSPSPHRRGQRPRWFWCVVASGGFLFLVIQAQSVRLDPALSVTLAAPGRAASSVIAQPDGRMIIAGSFTAIDAVPRPGVARLYYDGSLDDTFKPALGFVRSSLAPWTPSLIAVQPDGKLILAGALGSAGTVQAQVARLNADGSLDAGFGQGPTILGVIAAIALGPDGRVFLAGQFSGTTPGEGRDLACLNPDGTPDLDFRFGGLRSGSVDALAVQPDGQVVIAGPFSLAQQPEREGIARVRAAGSLDETFAAVRFDRLGAGGPGPSFAVRVQPDGKVLVAGGFGALNGIPRPGVARLNADGSLDPSFVPELGAGSSARAMLLQPDGVVILANALSYLRHPGDGSPSGLARLNSDGSLDRSFAWGQLFSTETDFATPDFDVTLLPGGGLVAVGFFNAVVGPNGAKIGSARNIARFSKDGAFEAGLNPVVGVPGTVSSAVRTPEGGLVLGGNFIKAAGRSCTGLARLRPDGTVDPAFGPVLEAWNGGFGLISPSVSSLAMQRDGKLILAGRFPRINGAARSSLARLGADGGLDLDYRPQLERDLELPGLPFETVEDIVRVLLQPDEKLLIAGSFQRVNGVPRRALARLHPDGTLDAGFDASALIPATGTAQVMDLLLSEDGQVLVSGTFGRGPGIFRLDPNGNLDTTFTAPTGVTPGALMLQPDGKLIFAGSISDGAGVLRRSIARLNADGAFDPTFDAGEGVTTSYAPSPETYPGTIQWLVPVADGGVLIAGDFTRVNGVPRNRVARLRADGTLDPLFDLVLQPETTGFEPVHLAMLQADPRDGALLSGNFMGVLGVPVTSLVRLAWVNDSGPPVLTRQPQPVLVELWRGATLSVAAVGAEPLTYQWQRNLQDIPSATLATLVVPFLGPRELGEYRCVLSNPFGTTISATATVFQRGALVIEAEDFNFGGGQHRLEADATDYVGGAFAGLSAIAEIDYHDPGPNEFAGYRAEDQGVAVREPAWSTRPGNTAGARFVVGWSFAGDWYNYTRRFPDRCQPYEIAARVSCGGTPGTIHLEEVIGGANRTDQAVRLVGRFDVPNTGGWDTFIHVPLQVLGAQAAFFTDWRGDRTLRLTHASGNADLDYVAFVPAPVADACGDPNDFRYRRQGRLLTFEWGFNGSLQQADEVTGPWQDLPNAVSPMTLPMDASRKYFRLYFR